MTATMTWPLTNTTTIPLPLILQLLLCYYHQNYLYYYYCTTTTTMTTTTTTTFDQYYYKAHAADLVQSPHILTIPRRIPSVLATWLRAAKAPIRLVGETSWMYMGFMLMPSPQNIPNTSRPTMSTSKDFATLDMDIITAPTTESPFIMRMELRLREVRDGDWGGE